MMRRFAIGTLALLILPVALRADQNALPAPDPVAAPAPAQASPPALAFVPAAIPAPASIPAAVAIAPVAGVAPQAWSPQDPADSLYRAARQAMNRGDHERAAALFHEVWDDHPRSAYAPDAPYWEAFNRYRDGDTSELERALSLLELQAERYEEAATRRNGDARSLETRIRGQLARRGDSDAAQSIVAAANEVGRMGAHLAAELGPQLAALTEMTAMHGEMIGQEIGRIAQEGVAMGMAMGRTGGGDVPEHCRDQVETQLAALNALLHMNAERALPVLRGVMERQDECAAPLRRRAIFLIADKHTAPETVDLLLSAARSDPDLEVRRQAVFWLSEADDPRAVRALETFLMESDDEKIRERALFALAQHRSPEAKRIVRRVARAEDMPAEIRGRAIFWLGTEGSDEDLDFLKEMFGRLDDPELDKRILFTVGQAERESDSRWLLSVAAADNMPIEVRRSAIFWAAEAGAPPAALGDLYDRLDDRKLRERIIFGLSQSSRPEAMDKLMEIARTEADPELRQKAIFWIGNSNDPRAADLLMDVLMDAQVDGGR